MNAFGDLPLHIAAWLGNFDACLVLLDNGADIKDRNSGMQTPLHIASTHDHMEIVQLIMGRAAKKGIKKELLEYRDCERRTAFLKALENENLAISKYLIDQGANIHIKYFNGLNAFYFASEFADRELMQMLLSRGVDVNNTTYGGFNSLHHAAARQTDPPEMAGHLEVCLMLIRAGARLSSNNPAKVSVLHCACHSGNAELVKELLRIMPAHEVNVKSNYYGTPLYTAAFRGHLDIVRLLIDAGADIEMKQDWETPLEAAIAECHDEVADYLSDKWWEHQRGGALEELFNEVAIEPTLADDEDS